jgi:xylitol oxidase
MNKRTFLKICSAAMTSPFLTKLAAWASQEKLHNWAGNVEYGTDRVYPARSVEEVQEFVRTQSKLKVLGTRHCFNHIADSHDQFLSMKAMDSMVELNAEVRTVTIESGMSYGKLCPILESKGWALHNLASLPHISVAGACSTATHGSGVKNGNLSTAVSGLEIVNAAGEVVKLSRAKDGETFQGAVVGLGALGAVTKVTLDLTPSYQMQQYVYENLPLDELTRHFDAIESAAYSVSLFTDWQKKRINEVWLKHRMENGKSFDAPPEFYGAKRATKNLHPIAELSAENCTEQMGVPGPHLLITEIRTIAADNLWMSPCYKQDSVTIHFTLKPDWPSVSKLLLAIEKELAPFHARPHWGKLFTMAPAHLDSLYEKLPEFAALSRRFDPAGKFHNDFLNTNVFGVVS